MSTALTFLPRSPNNLTDIEWELLEDCTPHLKPFESMSAELSGKNYQTLSMVIPLVRGLQYAIGKISPKTTSG